MTVGRNDERDESLAARGGSVTIGREALADGDDADVLGEVPAAVLGTSGVSGLRHGRRIQVRT